MRALRTTGLLTEGILLAAIIGAGVLLYRAEQAVDLSGFTPQLPKLLTGKLVPASHPRAQ
jgi:hypothetical protein